MLFEIRYPADTAKYWDRETGLDTNTSKIDYGHFGRVLYTHGIALDEPVGVLRLDYGPGTFFGTPIRFAPKWNWRGLAITGIFPNGRRYSCKSGEWETPADTTCVDVGWSGDISAFLRSKIIWANQNGTPAWEGSLIFASGENSDQLYMRNRYYDPVQGRFTQEDPIGLAGGLNAYGFASGDPVNHSDPFGLCSLAKWICTIVNAGSGFGDFVTLGFTEHYRKSDGFDDEVDRNGDYHSGQAAGFGVGLIDGEDEAQAGRAILKFTRAGLRDAINGLVDGIEGMSGRQGLKLLEKLKKGAVDEISVTMEEGGNMIASFLRKNEDGTQTIITRVIDRFGDETSVTSRTLDASGKQLSSSVLK